MSNDNKKEVELGKLEIDKLNDTNSYPLLNWPPSRGPMPDWMTKKPEYEYPESERIIIEKPIVRHAHAEAEKDVIESLVKRNKNMIGSMIKGKMKKGFKEKKVSVRKIEYIDLEVDLDVSVKVLGSIDLYTAMRLINGYTKDERNDDNKYYITLRGMVFRLPKLPITTEIYYPLSSKLKVTIHPYSIKRTKRIDLSGDCHDNNKDIVDVIEREPSKYMDVAYFLWRIAQEYKYIYKNHEQFGVWGHCLGDLVFEGVGFRKNGTAELYIGS